MYRGMVFDPDGRIRLNYDAERAEEGEMYPIDPEFEATKTSFDFFIQDAEIHYGFDDGQRKQASRLFGFYDGALNEFHQINRSDLIEYFKALDRTESYDGRRDLQEVDSLDGQATKVAGDARKLGAPMIAEIDALWANFETDVNAIATEEQREQAGYLELHHIDEPPMGLSTIDAIIPWFDLIIGGLLVVGLFVRPAAILGSLFLLSVVLSQWPLDPEAASTIYQVVLMFALLVLAALGAGRFLGLDYFIHVMWAGCCRPKTGDTNES
ncbi:MAG: hypothetical protein NXI22_12360 [bacterium]|nr:hypothetical protein [bacterium]